MIFSEKQPNIFGHLSSFVRSLNQREKQLIITVIVIFLVSSAVIRNVSTREPKDIREEKRDNYAVLHFFEIGGVLAFILAVLHALRHWKKSEVMIFFLSCFSYAFLFEDMNIQLSRDYSYNPNAWFIFHNTMMVIVLGWCSIVYFTVIILEKGDGSASGKGKIRPLESRRIPEKENNTEQDEENSDSLIASHKVTTGMEQNNNSLTPLEKGITAGLLVLTIDLGIDSTAFAYGLWFWENGSYFGVPIVNFVGWFGAVFWFVFGTEHLRKHAFEKNWTNEKNLFYRIIFIFPEYLGLLLFVGIAFGFLNMI